MSRAKREVLTQRLALESLRSDIDMGMKFRVTL